MTTPYWQGRDMLMDLLVEDGSSVPDDEGDLWWGGHEEDYEFTSRS